MMQKDWLQVIQENAIKYGHEICAITGNTPSRRSYVLWFCRQHALDGSHFFTQDDSKLNQLRNTADPHLILSDQEINQLIEKYPAQPFYCSRVDFYLQPSQKKTGTTRTFCCKADMLAQQSEKGFKCFQNLLKNRGEHYNTTYTLLIKPSEYQGKLKKYPIKCESHGIISHYSMQALNFTTSCPCPTCRIDPKHKNVAVDIVKKRNAGREGQVIRHAKRVKTKYHNKCALSQSTLELQHHHLDGQNFYENIALDWQNNGICLCGPIHRDYHFNFLKNHSIIAKEYSNYSFVNDFDNELDFSPELINSNPDFGIEGAEVSRYTFLEYLKFLIFDIQTNGSYVTNLNQKIYETFQPFANQSSENIGQITLDQLKKAMRDLTQEYKSDNWALANNAHIPFANDSSLWSKVDTCWN